MVLLNMVCVSKKEKISYDTRYFHKVVYGYTSEEIVTIKKRKSLKVKAFYCLLFK